MRNKVVIETQFLFDYEHPECGVTVGGTQRYAIALAQLFQEHDMEVTFLTKACRGFDETYLGIKIVAFNAPFGEKGNFKFSKLVYEYCCKTNPIVVCYSDILVTRPYCYKNSFAIQHGIAWDNASYCLKNYIYGKFYLNAARKLKKIICVDTNFINWYRERDKQYIHYPEKLVYIPNFAEEDKFQYKFKKWEKEEKKILLYPRRLVPHRGFDIFVNMCDQLLEEGFNIEPVLAFEDFREKDFQLSKMSKYPEKYRFEHPSLEEIASLYHEAFLAYVPTKWSEGTSLSAIEAMSCGCPAIVSDVGGLGNIVLPDFNGDIIPQSTLKFVDVTRRVLKDVEIRNEWSCNCKKMNDIFGMKRWKRKIEEEIRELIDM